MSVQVFFLVVLRLGIRRRVRQGRERLLAGGLVRFLVVKRRGIIVFGLRPVFFKGRETA